MKNLIYIIGKGSRFIRILYWKLTGRWFWGIVGFVKDKPECKCKTTTVIDDDELNRFIEAMSKM